MVCRGSTTRRLLHNKHASKPRPDRCEYPVLSIDIKDSPGRWALDLLCLDDFRLDLWLGRDRAQIAKLGEQAHRCV